MLVNELFETDSVDVKSSEYVKLPDPKVQRKNKKKAPTTDERENQLINAIWHQSNADAV
jgi:hypothetical protein